VLAQKIEQGGTRIDDNLVRSAIDEQRDRHTRAKFHLLACPNVGFVRSNQKHGHGTAATEDAKVLFL
jgi:hypothetical protein